MYKNISLGIANVMVALGVVSQKLSSERKRLITHKDGFYSER